jgi:alkanesulfonate monooxygenase SsuD/methylene tetrahydromethanopterin reductase-like flavin-dependent oxidoreductase (luciferase family)
LKDLDAAMPRIKTRLENLNPGPRGRLPILIGGAGEKVTLRIVAQYADIWHGFARKTDTHTPAQTVAHKNAVLDEWCEKLERDPASIERSIGVDKALIDLADEIHAAGADEIHMGVDGPDYDFAPVKDWLDWRDEKNSG